MSIVQCSLNQIPLGKRCKVTQLNSTGSIRTRLQDIGLVQGRFKNFYLRIGLFKTF